MPEGEIDALKNDPHRALIRLPVPGEPLTLAKGIHTQGGALATIYCDFGGVSIRHRLHFEGTMDEWVELSVLLSEHRDLTTASSEAASVVVRRLGDALIKPTLSVVVEDFSIICIEAPAEVELDKLITYEGQQITQIVNAEARKLHPDVISRCLDSRISWYADYVAFVEWPAALLFCNWNEEGLEQVKNTSNALEFVNMQLLQFEILSKHLDRAVLRAYGLPHSGAVSEDEQRELDELTMDCVELFGRVGSGLKIFSNVHLANLLKILSRKFEFQDRISEIRLKLNDLRSVRHGILEGVRHRQSHLIEILIAGLIVIELFPLAFDLLDWLGIFE